MKKVTLFALLVSALLCLGFTPPDHGGKFIVDEAGVIPDAEEAKIDAKLKSYAQSSQNEVAVLVVNTLGGESVEQAAYDTFNTWKVGKAEHDNGVLLLIAVKDRTLRIETGEGVEGDLTDLQAKNIIRNNIVPHLKKADYTNAVNSGVDGISNTLEKRPGAAVDNPSSDSGFSGWWILLIVGGSVFLVFIIARLGGSGGGGGGYYSGGSSYGSGGGYSGGGGFGGGSSGGGGASGSWRSKLDEDKPSKKARRASSSSSRRKRKKKRKSTTSYTPSYSSSSSSRRKSSSSSSSSSSSGFGGFGGFGGGGFGGGGFGGGSSSGGGASGSW